MKISRLLLLFTLVLFGVLLSACAGGTTTASGWPGLTVNGETAYLAYNTQVYAINLTNGTEKWHYPEKAANNTTFYAPPVLSSDGQLFVGGYNKLLYSLDPETGQENVGTWPFAGAANHYIAAPLVTDTGIYAPSGDGTLYALDLAGQKMWHFRTQHGLWATPVTDGQAVYLPGMDHVLYALHPTDGSLLWKSADLGGAIVGEPTLSPEGVLFVGTLGGGLVALDTQAEGKELWRTQTSGWVWSGPFQDGEMLYFGDLTGMLYGVNAADGKIVWQNQPEQVTNNSITERPLVNGDVLYFASESGSLIAVDKSNGGLRWNKPIAGKLYPSPEAAGDTILVAPTNNSAFLIALDLEGNQKWTFPAPKE